MKLPVLLLCLVSLAQACTISVSEAVQHSKVYFLGEPSSAVKHGLKDKVTTEGNCKLKFVIESGLTDRMVSIDDDSFMFRPLFDEDEDFDLVGEHTLQVFA